MKKILFCIRDFHTGGVQKSLLDLLKQFENEVKQKEMQIDVFCLKKVGELLADIPNYINLIEGDKKMWDFGLTQGDAKSLGIKSNIRRGIKAIIANKFGNKLLLNKALRKQKFLGDYDVVISWNVSISRFGLYAGWSEAALQKTNSNNKIVFIHNDYLNSSLNNDYTFELVNKFNKIVFVSESCKNDFVKQFPELKNKCDFLYNFVNCDEILNKSKMEKIDFDTSVKNIISVSRLSEEKAHLRSLSVIKRLKDEGLNFCWHVLGDGPMRQEIEKKVRELNLEDCVKLYGNKTNPYPYMKSADLFYLGSFNESFGLVLIDSMVLNVPVVTTRTIAADEIVGNYGFVCENDEDSIYECLKRVLINNELLKEKQSILKSYKYKNSDIKNKFIQLIKKEG